jgi:hypothetical protein
LGVLELPVSGRKDSTEDFFLVGCTMYIESGVDENGYWASRCKLQNPSRNYISDSVRIFLGKCSDELPQNGYQRIIES